MIRQVGEAGQERQGSPRAAGRAGGHGARRARVGLALRVPEGAARDARARARALGARKARGPRVHAGDPAGARARGGAVRHRLPAGHRAADLHAAGGRAVSRGHLRGAARVATCGRDARRGGAAAALRGLLALLPPRGRAPPARTRAGSSACTSSTRWRCSRSCGPTESADEHERILAIEEEILQALEIPYRVANIPAWDLGASAAKKYDLEAWLPGQERYRELTSCSNTTDFQARRLGVRYRPEGGSPEEVHTLNGTAVAVGRTIIADRGEPPAGRRHDPGAGSPSPVRGSVGDSSYVRILLAVLQPSPGGVAERLNATVLKTVRPGPRVSWVRIPPPPLRSPA